MTPQNMEKENWKLALKTDARAYFVERWTQYKESGDRSDFGRFIDDIVDMTIEKSIPVGEQAMLEKAARIVETWHIKKGGLTELAHVIRSTPTT